MEYEKLHSLEVEKTILGAMIIDSNSCIQVIEEKVREEDFYYTHNKILFRTIKNIFKDKATMDLLLLIEELKDKNLLSNVNGVSYVTDISTSVITSANLINYIEILKEYSQKRKLIAVSNHIRANIGKGLEELQQEVTGLIAETIEDENNTETSDKQEEEYLYILEKRIKGEINPIKTGLTGLDNKISGFSGGDLVTIFAFSGIGKTTLAAQIGLNSIRKNKKILFFSLEMTKEQVRDRLISNLTNISFQSIRSGQLNDKELDTVIKASAYLSANNKLLISTEDELINITSKIQVEIMKNDIDVIFIDYINLINITGNNKEEHYKVAECTRLLKKLAIKINKPIVILAQGKQECASKITNKNLNIWEKVAVNDIAGGASIYRDSDIVIGMYRNIELDNKVVRDILANQSKIDYSSTDPDVNPECMNLLIKKSRASGKDIIAVKWKAQNYRISNWY
ncbi:MAG: DnaB-like helicase C-terminal domain-containing protein [Clostridium septicum]|uniref:DnaB-like helicase C-terminal domain-containing protein n=1 Tax=Clostridium septicum TaxID=1504 RepID=UPI0025869D9A|nr:DnaB-like helicase C-terminal domain-containing protein [Clostridium septicum]MDU1313262.1 DnaB-like helicase C-terminal domain-containing protein [Clostridium septicum]